MRSGYSGEPLLTFQHTYATLASQLRSGMEIRDIEGTFVGTLHQLDSRQETILVVKCGLDADVLVVPFSAIARVDTADYIVNLLVPQERLRDDLAALLPATITPITTGTMAPPPTPPATGDTP